MTKRTVKNLSNQVLSEESFTYDAAGNITDAPGSCFAYDTNNRLVTFNGNAVSYDLDGNMLSNGSLCCTYDSANRLISAGGHTYTYNAEDVRIRNLCADADTTYLYDTNAKLSKLLCKTTGGITTKYVYGRGLIGEEKFGNFKTYHFDCRGSTVAISDMSGNITDTFAYDTYGKLISRTGSSFVIFGYNGRDGVVTDTNGLIYMRARYYSPDMKRFINADIIAGEISNAVTLNRFAYANGNPVSFIDPFGLRSMYFATHAMIKNDIGHITPHYQNALAQDKYMEAKRSEIRETATSVKEWFEETGEWLNENARNKDGSYALYDNQRDDNDAVFHEQILAFTPSGPSLNLKEGNIGLGSLAVDAITGGWEGEHANLSLFDFGHAEASLEVKDYQISVGAFASAWSPSFSVTVSGVTFEIGAEVGAVGVLGELGAHGAKLRISKAVGFTIGLTW